MATLLIELGLNLDLSDSGVHAVTSAPYWLLGLVFKCFFPILRMYAWVSGDVEGHKSFIFPMGEKNLKKTWFVSK